MTRFDRYLLSQLMVLFGFFSLVLVSVYWINSAVKLFDSLIGEGQSAWIFAEFTALSLPSVIRMVLPVSAFAAAVYVTNRLSSESELTVMQATGFSPWRLARPVLYFGLTVAFVMTVLTHYLVPTSTAQLAERRVEISRNVTARLLTEGTFLHPTGKVTFYIRRITPEGALEDVFLSDRRNPRQSITYTADTAYIVRSDSGAKLVMIEGLSQTYNRESGRLFTTHFSDFSYDISAMIAMADHAPFRVTHAFTGALLRDAAGVAARSGASPGAVAEELHGRFSQALLCAVAALIGFSTLLVGGFSRFGVWRQIVAAIVILVVVKLIEGMVAEPVRADAALWPLIYLPSLFGLALVSALLAWSGRNRRRLRRLDLPDAGAPA